VIEQGSVTSKVLAGRKRQARRVFALNWTIPRFDQFSPDFSDRMDLPLHPFALRGTIENSGARQYCASIKP